MPIEKRLPMRVSRFAVLLFALCIVCTLTACNTQKPLPEQHFDLKGKIVAVNKNDGTLTLATDAIPGYMAAMTIEAIPSRKSGVLDVAKPGQTLHRYEQNEWKIGCPIGNLTQEMGILNEAFQTKLRKVFNGMKNAIRTCLVQAQVEGDVSPALDGSNTPADFILNSWEGALLRMKAEGHTGPLVLFQKMVFDLVLKR